MGAVAEAAVTTAATELGLTVLKPLCEGQRYDLVIDCQPRLLRVQCKLARRVKGALLVPLKTNRCTPEGYVSTSYDAEEIDAVAVYDRVDRRCFLIPVSEAAGRRAMHLRLDATRNNQASRIKWARDYDFQTAIMRLGSAR